MSNDSNWCPEIYRGLFVDHHNDDCVRVAPCCQAQSSIEHVDGFDFSTSPWLQNLRESFNRNEKPSACNKCWDVERLGHKSRRQSAKEFFNLSTESKEIMLQGLDHSATWACNLACIMCGPELSSTWARELDLDRPILEKMGRLFQKKNHFFDRLDLKDLKKLHFNGGEPLINKDQNKLLQKIKDLGILQDMLISYNTNGTVMPDEKIQNIWADASLVKIFFSIDATGDAFEYIRYPGRWNDTAINILTMKNTVPHNVMFGFNVTVGSYNILEIRSIWDWFQENISTNREGDPSDFCWQIAENFDPANIPQAAKDALYKDLDNIPKLSGIIQHVKSRIHNPSRDKWIESLEKIDSRRGTNWRQVLRIAKFY